ncbi:hypothetical protein [Pseudacidovorax sp. RU35E]|uniref:hypothetical protein n=1 Tax=Pseudacidovorax sp. RU35E TaxID=1907403 RepID=UPI0009565381|nr:hypothetical protein [Pseudacidovorax sp. RU35E]SIR00551.1 hypothetical protein SAMN05880557_10799 [Pseudacidovorax sp. RU35E]
MTTYRCFYAPLDKLGSPTMAEAGVLPFVQLQATNAEDALRKAHHVTGCPVTEAQRLEDAVQA